MKVEQCDVVIIGAGLAGLSTAVFLGLNGIRARVVERHPATSILPKARGQNPVTMETLRVAGIADAIHAARPPGRPGITSLVSQSLTGPVFHDHVAHRPDFARFSPERPGMASQARAEQALLERALELGADVRFNCVCESVTEHDDHVQLTLREDAADSAVSVQARYLVAADGIRGMIPAAVGIGYHGLGHLKSVTAVRFNADLSRWSGGNAMTIHYVKNARLPDGSGILVSTDYPGQWVANFSADPARDIDTTRSLIRVLLGDADAEIEVTGDTTYDYHHRIADRLCTRRVFLAGDAAHVMPPTGGQGGNTAMQDGYYLGWKLAYVLRGLAGESLLASYDTERRPYAEIVCTWQAANLAERRDMKGLSTVIGPPIDHATMMFGYVCAAGALVRGGDDPVLSADQPFEDPLVPTGMPGARVPFVDLQAAGEVINTRRRLAQHFEVYTAQPGCAAQADALAARLGVPSRSTVVASMQPLRLADDQAMLVRPDGVVAWRGTAAGAELAAAYAQVLGRAGP